jgi:hypothetical protein
MRNSSLTGATVTFWTVAGLLALCAAAQDNKSIKVAMCFQTNVIFLVQSLAAPGAASFVASVLPGVFDSLHGWGHFIFHSSIHPPARSDGTGNN